MIDSVMVIFALLLGACGGAVLMALCTASHRTDREMVECDTEDCEIVAELKRENRHLGQQYCIALNEAAYLRGVLEALPEESFEVEL